MKTVGIGGETFTCEVAVQIQQIPPVSSLRITPERQQLYVPTSPLPVSPVEKPGQFILACGGLSIRAAAWGQLNPRSEVKLPEKG